MECLIKEITLYSLWCLSNYFSSNDDVSNEDQGSSNRLILDLKIYLFEADIPKFIDDSACLFLPGMAEYKLK